LKSQVTAGKALRFSAVVAITLALLSITFALISVTGAGGSSGSVAHAAGNIVVNTFDDEYDTTPNGNCSLREAVQSIIDGSSFGGCANPGDVGDTVLLQAGTYTLTRLLASGSTQTNSVGSLYVHNSYAGNNFTVNILGAGPDQTIISTTASFDDRIFGFYDSSSNNTSSVAIEGVTIQGGNGGYGGGIYVQITSENASFSLKDAVVQHNQSTVYGGGLYLGEGTGSTTLQRVTIYDNRSNYGGGIYYTDQYGAGKDNLGLINVTIYSNTAQFTGGGLYAGGSGGGIGALNMTIAQNKGTSGGNIYNAGTIVRLKNTVLDDGLPTDCWGNPSANIKSLGYNLSSDNSCNLTGTLDVNNTDPLLDSQLQYHGSAMPTLALLDNSPAIDQGSGCPDTDQRGWLRVGPCDRGAYEYPASVSLPLVLKRD
jgi:CSLREA domain-containing protein